jgi:hypothetical protein
MSVEAEESLASSAHVVRLRGLDAPYLYLWSAEVGEEDVMKRSSASLLLLIAAFCVYGFLASFEPGPNLAFRIGYPVVGVLCLGSAVWLFSRK